MNWAAEGQPKTAGTVLEVTLSLQIETSAGKCYFIFLPNIIQSIFPMIISLIFSMSQGHDILYF